VWKQRLVLSNYIYIKGITPAYLLVNYTSKHTQIRFVGKICKQKVIFFVTRERDFFPRMYSTVFVMAYKRERGKQQNDKNACTSSLLMFIFIFMAGAYSCEHYYYYYYYYYYY